MEEIEEIMEEIEEIMDKSECALGLDVPAEAALIARYIQSICENNCDMSHGLYIEVNLSPERGPGYYVGVFDVGYGNLSRHNPVHTYLIRSIDSVATSNDALNWISELVVNLGWSGSIDETFKGPGYYARIHI